MGRHAGSFPRWTVDDVEQIAALGEPEALVERLLARDRRAPARSSWSSVAELADPPVQQAQRVVPERVDLHGLAAPRRHDPVVDLRVHPRELIARRRPASAGRRRDRRRCRTACPRDDAVTMSVSLGSELADRVRIARHRQVAVHGVEEPQRRVGRVIEPLAGAVGNMFGIRPSRT